MYSFFHECFFFKIAYAVMGSIVTFSFICAIIFVLSPSPLPSEDVLLMGFEGVLTHLQFLLSVVSVVCSLSPSKNIQREISRNKQLISFKIRNIWAGDGLSSCSAPSSLGRGLSPSTDPLCITCHYPSELPDCHGVTCVISSAALPGPYLATLFCSCWDCREGERSIVRYQVWGVRGDHSYVNLTAV